MNVNKNRENMDNDKIVKVYWDLHRMHKNENNPQIALKIAERKQELWNYAKKHGFHRELLE
jgi:hypothetical protein